MPDKVFYLSTPYSNMSIRIRKGKKYSKYVWFIDFPNTGRVWGLEKKWTYRELFIVFLFALEQFTSIRKVIGNHFAI